MDRVEAVARHCDTHKLFETDEVLVSAGGSAIFDLVAGRLKPALGKPVRGLLRSGCYVTHDHGFYKRMVSAVDERLGCEAAKACVPGDGGLGHGAVAPRAGPGDLAVGKRDISFDLSMPVPIARAARGAAAAAGRARRLEDHRAERPARLPALGRERRSRGARWWATASAWASRTPAPPSTNGTGCRWSRRTTA
jgi:D-serine deaminase-like pyridoxal phosphate-dependent protein